METQKKEAGEGYVPNEPIEGVSSEVKIETVKLVPMGNNPTLEVYFQSIGLQIPIEDMNILHSSGCIHKYT